MRKKNHLGIFIRPFFRGTLIIDPLSATVWIIWSISKSVDNLVPNILRQYPGAVSAAVLSGTAPIGFVGDKLILGQLFVSLMGYIVVHIPGVRIIYLSIRDMLAPFVGGKRELISPVWVRVNETLEIWRIGFLTQHTTNLTNLEGMISVYLSHSYTISGWVIVTSAENTKPAEDFAA